MTNSLEDEVRNVLAHMDGEQDQQEPQTDGNKAEEQLTGEPGETIHIHYFPDAIVILKEEAPKPDQVVDSDVALTPVPATSIVLAVFCACIAVLAFLLPLFLQLYLIFHPPTATVTIVPKSQQIMLSGTLQLGRILAPLTISQSQTVPTTGKGHQDAKAATGYLTFYNGQLQSVTVPAGTVLTSSNGVQVITDQDAFIPAASPPIEGQVTIIAHAVATGIQGNIAAKAINEACCAISVLAVNLTPFHGGQDERDFSTVSPQDINKVSTPLITAVAQSVNGAFQGPVKPNEQLYLLPCSPTILSDHQPGQEASLVKVTVSETCSAIAYDNNALLAKTTALLSTQAPTKLGTGYCLIGQVQVNVTQATVTNISKPLVFLSFHAQGTWVYALSLTAQQHIKSLIAGKTKQEASQLLVSLPGVEQASIRWDGFGDDTKLPKDTRYIHFHIIIQSS